MGKKIDRKKKKSKNNRNKKAVDIKGVISKHSKGYAFVTPEIGSPFFEKGDIFVATKDVKDAMDGDLVQVTLLPQYMWGNLPKGKVIKVLKRNLKTVVGTFERSPKYGFVLPEDKKISDDIFVSKKHFGEAKDGDKVRVEIINYPQGGYSAEGKVVEIIARKKERNADIKALIAASGVEMKFSDEVLAEANAVATGGISSEELSRRKDLRELYTVTIDGANSKDFDDAVSIKKLPNGNYNLGVHIADVAHYVKAKSELDKQAFIRGNSIYAIDEVVPMLPEVLSNGICSLNPDEDRLTLTCEMQIDAHGKVVSHEIYESIIRSHARLIYDDVSDILEAGAVTDENKYLFEMAELAKILHKRRSDKGSINFEVGEAEIVLSKKGKVAEIKPAERRIANRLIEEFMLIANETVAEHFFWMNVPFIYRVHEKPTLVKMEELKLFLKGIGIQLSGDLSEIKPFALKRVLDDVVGKPYENVVNKIMLRSMQKATYETKCEGHFGLAFKYYCHFTSPIRRYPDLCIHRIIKKVIRGELSESDLVKLEKFCRQAAKHSSETERTAIDIERDAIKIKMTDYIRRYIGCEFDGVISGVTDYGIYVQLTNFVEGMVRSESIEDDYYDFEPEKYRLIGRNTHKTYALGDKVTIRVLNADVSSRKIDFIIK